MSACTRILLSMILLLTSCSSFTGKILKDPEVQLQGLDVSSISAKEVSINLRLNVKNPNPIPLKLNEINYALKVSGKMVTEGVFDKGVNIPADGEGEVVVPLKFEYNTIGSLLEGLIKKSITRDYELNGAAKIGIFSIPFTKKGAIELEGLAK